MTTRRALLAPTDTWDDTRSDGHALRVCVRLTGLAEKPPVPVGASREFPASTRGGNDMPAYLLDRSELAWAAGFFDGEGTAILANLNSQRRRPNGKRQDYPTPHLAVTQHYDPETVHRFHRAVLGLGKVYGPHVSSGTANHPRWQWAARRPVEVLAVVPMLWPFLSGPKRRQIAGVVSAYLVDAQQRRPYRAASRGGKP